MHLNTNKSLQSIYDTYYDGDSRLLKKREITACQTFQHLNYIAGNHSFGRVIDVGAGEGSLLQQLGQNHWANELYGVEISNSGVEVIKRKKIQKLASIKSFDGYHIPFEDQYFDAAISIHVLEHVEHERAFLYELKRVAKHILIEVPLEHTVFINKAINQCHGHINFYTTQTFKNLLKTSGLKCINMKNFPVSRELEVFMSGQIKGSVKNLIRSTTLSLTPRIATQLMHYMCIAHCVQEGD